MKTWKWLVGAGAACVACCAIPILGGSAAAAAGAGGLLACADEFVVPALAVGTAALLSGVLWWRSRRLQRARACGCAANDEAMKGPDHGAR